MKKQMLAVLTAALITAGLAACGSNDAEEPGGSGSPMAAGSGSYPDSAASDGGEADPGSGSDVSGSGGTETGGAEEESAQDEGEEKVRYIYGETAIPDIPCGDGGFEGKADLVWESEDRIKLQQALDSMVFETHTFGDMTRLPM